ncbi:signal peptidase I [Nocardioides bruguierae]|uniref:Signal peptidase I n=1 Tax=Nocardioides bruguierae TaxID=2945102 RepID=A0A9X2DB05_9ACTN|nr:signal peptidase I [Nocardioides bruguierae]MCM0622067.1 signal peptidase I [Nocardioides bruguierae]
MGSPVLLTLGPARTGWCALLVTTAARAVLAVLAGLVVWSVLPVALGWHSTVTVSGSMLPRIEPSDVVVSAPLDPGTDLRAGWIVLVDSPAQPGTLLVHRVVEVREDGSAITRGDANAEPDSDPVAREDVLGLARLRVPYVGRPFLWWHDGHALTPGALGTGLGLLLVVLLAEWYRQGPEEWDDQHDQDDRADRAGRAAAADPTGVPDRLRGPAVGVLSLLPVLLPVALALLLGASAVLPGAGAVLAPASAAYRSTTSTSPYSATAAWYSCQRAPLAHGPVLAWRLDETGGTTAADASGTGNTGTYHGGPALAQGRACGTDTGTSVRLDGIDDFVVSTTAYTAPSVYTVELWFSTTTTSGGKLIGFESGTTAWGWSYDRMVYMRNDGRLVCGAGPSITIASSAAYNDGAWHHVAATMSAAGMRLYVDGAQVGSSTNTVSQSFSGYWRIGSGGLSGWPGTPSSEKFAGYVDDVAGHHAARY